MHDVELTMHGCSAIKEILVLLAKFLHCIEPMHLIGRIVLIAHAAARNVSLNLCFDLLLCG